MLPQRNIATLRAGLPVRQHRRRLWGLRVTWLTAVGLPAL